MPQRGARCAHRGRCMSMAQMQQLADAVCRDDIDAALQAGLLDAAATCAACIEDAGISTDIAQRIVTMRDARIVALAARERHRARHERLQARAKARDAKRRPDASTASSATTSALPAAAAAALARAKARAANAATSK